MIKLSLQISFFILTLVLALFSQANAQFVEHQKLTGDREERAEFGTSVDLNESFAVVGASRENIATGAAYVYRKIDSNWEFSQKIQAQDGVEMAEFAGGVKLGNDFLAVASGRADIAEMLRAGAIYIYNLVGNDFEFHTKLIASDYSDGALLAVNPTSMDVENNTIVAGAPGTLDWTGAVYVFEREGEIWIEKQKILAPESVLYSNFGIGVSISGNYLAAGASGENNGAGKVYIYEKNQEGLWNFTQEIQASDAHLNTYFGNAISISGDQMVVGAYAEGHGSNNFAAAYIYERNDSGQWIEIQKISGSESTEDSFFAWMCEMKGNRMIISEPHIYGFEPGKVLVYEKMSEGVWEEIQSLTPAEDIIEDSFGWSIAMHEDELIIGASRDNFDENGENEMMDAGSAFIFKAEDLGNSEEISLNSIFVYPNPAKDLIHIKNTEKIQSVTIYSISGQKILTAKESSIDVSKLQKGNYFIQIKMSAGNTKTLKFIKN